MTYWPHSAPDEPRTTQLCVLPRCTRDDRPARRATVGLLCPGHAAMLAWQIAELPAITHWLTAHTRAGSGADYDPVTGTRELPAPVNLVVLSLVGPVAARPVSDPHGDQDPTPSIPATLDDWCRVVADDARLAGPTNAQVETLAAYLTTHFEVDVAPRPWVDEFAADIAGLHRHAHAAVPWKLGRHELPAPCPTCDMLTLVRYDGARWVECEARAGGCGRLFGEDDYAFLVRVLAEEVRGSAS